MAQTSVTTDPPVAREGMLADASHKEVISKKAEGALPAGRFVSRGTADDQAVLPTAAGDVTIANILGVTMYLASREPNTAAAEYADEEMVSILAKGKIWMVAEDAVAAGGQVFIRHTTTGAEEEGRVRSDADTADAVAIGGMRFEGTTAGADELVIVSVNLPA